MKSKSSIANTIENTERKAQYDKQVKELLADKNILARILKGCVDECKSLTIEEIKSCINGEISVGSERIEGHQQEDTIIGEGTVVYDIKFDITLPNSKEVKIIIDIEAQKNTTDYDLVTRGVFYLARLLSSQLKTEFEIKQSKSYDNLKKVYSIWICMDVPKSEADTITKYSIKPENLFGDYSKETRYDLASLIMIRLKKENPESKNELIGMLTTLLSNNLSKEEKEEKLSILWQQTCN